MAPSVSLIEVCDGAEDDNGHSNRYLKLIEISSIHPSSRARLETTDPEKMSPPPRPYRAQNHLDRLPDELLQRILNFSATGSFSDPISLDPYEVDWRDEQEVIQEVITSSQSFGTLRLVCWRFFHLATPLFLKRVVICDSTWRNRPAFDLILGLSTFLSTITPVPSHQVQSTNSIRPGSSSPSPASSLPYGHYVKQLFINNRTISPNLMYRLIDTIHSLIPNLKSLCGLNLSEIQSFFCPSIRFPDLVSLARIDIGNPPNHPTTQHHHHYHHQPNHSDLNPRLVIPVRSLHHHFLSQEVLIGILNHHPYISHLSCRGLRIDESEANRMITLLRNNQISTNLLSSPSHPEHFMGLRMLHIGLGSKVDLQFLKLLPRVTPHLLRLQIDAGCQLETDFNSNCQSWSLNQLWSSLPKLTHFTFIGQHDLPKRQGSIDWASSNQLLTRSPNLESINIRMETITSCNFLEGLTRKVNEGEDRIEELNIWYRPPIQDLGEELIDDLIYKNWSIIFFESKQEIKSLTEIFNKMIKFGLEWPVNLHEQRDLWFKFKSLTKSFSSSSHSNS